MANKENDGEFVGLVNYDFEKQHTTPEVTGPPPEPAKAEGQDLSVILDIILGVVTDG